MEQIQITGNIGQDAVIKEFSGTQYGSFTVGVNNSYTNADGVKVESTNWHNVLTREVKRVQWLKKGTKVFVQGRPKASIYRNKDGEAMISRDISANYIDILVFVKEEPTDQQAGTPAAAENPTPSTDEDGLPF